MFAFMNDPCLPKKYKVLLNELKQLMAQQAARAYTLPAPSSLRSPESERLVASPALTLDRRKRKMKHIKIGILLSAGILALYYSPPLSAQDRPKFSLMTPQPVLHFSFDAGKAQLPEGAKVVGASFIDEGKINGAYSFSGKGDYIILEDPEELPEGRSPRSISLWFKLKNPDRRGVMGGYGSPQIGENFQIEAGAGKKFWIMGWGKHRDWGTGIENKFYFDDRWHHIVVSYNSKITKVFIDGIMKASTSKFHWDTVASRIVLGQEIDLEGRSFVGFLDEFMIFDKDLSASQVRALYNWAK